ncbi:MAG TPA: HEPN/Toprim-associated domain-containing protein [Rhizomicrobium sp.]|nr:HEPN/Toprim-associated domain-containing protein [Rhizomicrobium sp.]
MGTAITLEVGGMTLDYSKNHRGNDHGPLFQDSDRQRFHSYEVVRRAGADDEDNEQSKPVGFRRTLGDTVPRLKLLGYSIESAAEEYAAVCEAVLEDREFFEQEGLQTTLDIMSFIEFRAFVTTHALADLSDEFVSLDPVKMRGRFTDDSQNQRLPHSSMDETVGYSELSHFGNLIGVLHPYHLLVLLAENASNNHLFVDWQYGPLVESGWAKEEVFVADAKRGETFLVATEGSSDAYVLRHAFKLLASGIEDFFRFIDVSERHPFPGTGNLLKFAEGLVKIDVQNQIIFLFDNDAEGAETHQRVVALNLPGNMRSLVLPETDEFKSFPTRGPDGVALSDINRKAASIECYLDLVRPKLPAPQIVWTNYRKETDTYQGALEQKEAYTKAFLHQTSATVEDRSYDFSKIALVLTSLTHECSGIAQSQRTIG